MLACEWIAVHLAALLGLPTLQFAIVDLPATLAFRFPSGGFAEAGPAFVTKEALDAIPWSGQTEDLRKLENLADITRMVVLDTWILNCDRYRPSGPSRLVRRNCDNVLLVGEGARAGHFRLVAMDHTHSFTCGRSLDARIANIGQIKSMDIFGLFPEIIEFVQKEVVLDCAARLAAVSAGAILPVVESVPSAWGLDAATRTALVRFVHERAQFLSTTILDSLGTICWPQTTMMGVC